MALAKNWIFNLYFNYKDEASREWAKAKRDESLTHVKKTMERMSRFSVIAKDGNGSCLMLRGYMHLNNPCTREYVKKVLGKYSSCSMTNSGDVVNLLKHFNVDKDMTVTGELPSQNSRKKDDANWVMKVVREHDFEFSTASGHLKQSGGIE
jgi:pyruvate dehydrogenase complex dehydrogenase (E1) component